MAHSLVSVVTPVYNGAEYLAECIESVLRQSHSNWTYEIVDNASTDATPDICEYYARRDSRVVHRRFDEFLEHTDNHNRALACIDNSSDWCKIVLADDWLYPECLERMLSVAGKSSSIGIVSAYQRWGDIVHVLGVPYQLEVLDGRKVLAWNLTSGNRTGNATTTLIRSDLIQARQPFYDESLEHSDADAAYWILLQADFGFVHQLLTYARRQGNTRYDRRAINMETYIAEETLFLIRYGPLVLDEKTYRVALRRHLRRYVASQAKNALRFSSMFDDDYFEFHDAALESIRSEAAADRDVERAAKVILALLARRRLLAGGRRGRH